VDLPQRSGCLEEKNAKTQGRKDAKVVDLPQRSGCLVVDLPQRSGCLDFSPEGDTSLPVCVSHRIARLKSRFLSVPLVFLSVPSVPLCFALLSPPSTPYRSQPCTSNFLAVGCGLNEVASRLKSRFLSVPLVFLSVPSVPLCFALLSPPSTPYRS